MIRKKANRPPKFDVRTERFVAKPSKARWVLRDKKKHVAYAEATTHLQIESLFRMADALENVEVWDNKLGQALTKATLPS